MAIVAKASSGQFEPCPAGPQVAVCVDVIDVGLVKSTFTNLDGTDKWQHKVDIVWQSAETMADGRPYLVKKRYTLSLDEKATLRHDLVSWRGKEFTALELEAFDVEKVLGANGILNVAHKAGSKGGTFANVVAVMPMMKGQAKITATADYVRVVNRPVPAPEAAQEEAPATEEEQRAEDRSAYDDEIPF
jgi:hypothetical protein